MLMLVMEAVMISMSVLSMTEHVPIAVLTTKEATLVDVKIAHLKSETGLLSFFNYHI